ncbi:MAG: hypothetical protein HQL69_00985 [Magnetococcales bacterium]|nr:hypothetical protein [Magnetococcales bacterium]
MAEENETEAPAPAPAEDKSASPPAEGGSGGKLMPIFFLLMLLAGLGGAYVYLDEKVQIKIKEFDKRWADKQVDLRSMARQRMYDTSQSHLQTEMMDRWRENNSSDTAPQ